MWRRCTVSTARPIGPCRHRSIDVRRIGIARDEDDRNRARGNEELQTINEELRQRGDDLNRSNGVLEAILTGMRSGVVVLDRELHVIAWNPRAEDLWGLRADEVQAQTFLNLDIGLPIEQLRAASAPASMATATTGSRWSLPLTGGVAPLPAGSRPRR